MAARRLGLCAALHETLAGEPQASPGATLAPCNVGRARASPSNLSRAPALQTTQPTQACVVSLRTHQPNHGELSAAMLRISRATPPRTRAVRRLSRLTRLSWRCVRRPRPARHPCEDPRGRAAFACYAFADAVAERGLHLVAARSPQSARSPLGPVLAQLSCGKRKRRAGWWF